MNPVKILTVGGATQDVTFQTKDCILVDNKRDLIRQKLLGFEFGAKVNIKDVDFTFGGGAANTSVSFAKLDNRVTSFVCLGNDSAGKEIIKNLSRRFGKNSIKTNLIQCSNKPSGLSFIINAKNLKQEHILFTYRGANEDLDLSKLYSTNIRSPRLTDSNGLSFDLIYLSSLSGTKNKINLSKIFRYKQEHLKTKIVWNPGNEQIKLGLNYLKTYLKNTDIFIVNKDEAIEICLSINPQSSSPMKELQSLTLMSSRLKERTMSNQQINNPRLLLKILSEYCQHQGVIVITDGSNGAYGFYNNRYYFEPSCNVKIKDTTGVGDAFGSTFVWALYYTNYNIQKSLNLAIKNACSVLKKVGAQNGLLNKKELFRL